MQITEILVAAREAVDEAELDDALRAIAFEKAFDFIARGAANTFYTEMPDTQAPVPVTADGLTRIAERLKLDRDTVEQVFYVSGSEIDITVSPKRLSPSNAGATKELAILVAAGRQAIELDEWTSVEVIREWCQRFRRYDGPNFAGSLKAVDEAFQFRGSGNKREVRVSRPGWETASDLVKRLTNGAE